MGDDLRCAVKWVTSGVAAREELLRCRYEIVLLDYRLQDTDGLSFLSEMQQMPRDTQPVVIMLTGGGSEEIAVEAMKRGAMDYLVKGSLDQPTMRRSMLAALERRRLERQLARYTEEIREKNAQMEAELEMARDVQQALIPQQYPSFPNNAGPGENRLSFAHRWIPSSGMAGDFFEVIPLSDSKAGLLLCDVMGHGVRAALITSLIRGVMEDLMPMAEDPGLFLKELNTHLLRILRRSNTVLFATAVYLVIDLEGNELRMANAGHPHPLLLRADPGEVSFLSFSGQTDPALGLLADTEYTSHSLPFLKGDSVLVYTDGLYEAENADGEAYGLERLKAITQSCRAEDTSILLNNTLGDLRAFLQVNNAAMLADDICVVAATRS
jgi:sigma-B regulation protein RsbU (phosphoserine phosphatase)